MKLIFVVSLILLASCAYAETQRMKLVGYEEVDDCKYLPNIINVEDEHGQISEIRKKDDRCK